MDITRTDNPDTVDQPGLAAGGLPSATPWQLGYRKFRKHRLAMASAVLILALYVIAGCCEFIAPYTLEHRHVADAYAPPQRLHWREASGRVHLWPFVYPLQGERDPETLRKLYAEDTTRPLPLRLFVKGEPYKLWGLIPADRHLLGVEGGQLYLLGTDRLGRDLFSRIVYGARISLTIGLVGVLLSFVFGLFIGGMSGYLGGWVDHGIQRFIEVVRSFPAIPLWMALTAALPAWWTPLQSYFGITIVLSLIGWTGLARQVRGKILSLREEDFVVAATLAGAGKWRILTRHLLPSFMSHIIVSLTLAIPGMILGETALSFLGLGLRPPVTSWGVLLREAQNVQAVAIYPWLLAPVVFVMLTVLVFNFVGDGLRDAADPYSR